MKLFRSVAALLAVAGTFALGAASAVAAGRPIHAGSPPAAKQLRLQLLSVHNREVRVRVWVSRGVDHDAVIDVSCGGRTVARTRLATLTTQRRTVVITVRRGLRLNGTVTVSVSARR